ncbi:MAG: hypothetical protein ABI886_02145 [Betaproteobacteria bacterium]
MTRRGRLAGRSSVAFVAALAVVSTLAAIEFYAVVRHGHGPLAPPVGAPTLPPAPAASTNGWVDAPAGDAVVGPKIYVKGWALDRAGIDRVEVRFDGKSYVARYAIARSDVALAKPGFPDSAAAGFEFTGDFTTEIKGRNGRHELAIVAVGRNGNEKLLATKYLVPAADDSPWRALYVARRMDAAPPFFVLPGVSGVSLGGPREIDTAYRSYVSPTIKVGMRVPILYLRTTQGAANDWTFDPEWAVERRCGDRRIAEDSLAAVLRYSVEHRVPVLLTLNGGVWADAGCDVPAWDVNDHLEQDKANCQWNQDNEVMADDYLKHLPGSGESPELGRMLTFNVHAAQNRHYKKRNLQAAGKIVAAFAREHPALFAGVNLDPDTYHNPFYDEKQWYDYNPGMVLQFREWLQGTGPYGGAGVPDLRAYRRARPLTLAEVNTLAGRDWKNWSDVDPPRAFPRTGRPFWDDPWTHEWERFRRHTVDLHYDELSQWLAEVGIPPAQIFSSQGFMGPHPAAMPFSVRLDSPSKNYDTGGMSVEGAIPKDGHVGAIVYGTGAQNDIRMETPGSLFATFHRMDPGWAVVEFNTADLRDPKTLPTYAAGYRALAEMFNYGARLVSPMAWNGSNGINANDPGYVSYTAWRNTPLEHAMRDFAISHAYVPQGARLWTFGTPRVASNDGWGAEAGTALAPGNGYVDVRAVGATATLLSPANLAVGRGESDLIVVGIDATAAVAGVRVEGRAGSGAWVALGPERAARGLERTSAGLLVPLAWPAGLPIVDQFRITLVRTDGTAPLRIRHLALYPPANAAGARRASAR